MTEVKVPIQELRERLDECLGRVRAGEVILITEGGAPVARVSPARRHPRLDERLRQLKADGEVMWGGGRFAPVRQPAELTGDGAVSALLVEDRG